ncbi:hypothetical protein CRG98_020877 [Punica granatum]|uniref:Uncharacterized protein n=1 Tax=Punica granatum TaxID=22663 RepID=A0A2I0JR54_PUNGR|nr:hypothetical protein CRG98_020877 [Punica granatum]
MYGGETETTDPYFLFLVVLDGVVGGGGAAAGGGGRDRAGGPALGHVVGIGIRLGMPGP